jgi:hypothetical protein
MRMCHHVGIAHSVALLGLLIEGCGLGVRYHVHTPLTYGRTCTHTHTHTSMHTHRCHQALKKFMLLGQGDFVTCLMDLLGPVSKLKRGKGPPCPVAHTHACLPLLRSCAASRPAGSDGQYIQGLPYTPLSLCPHTPTCLPPNVAAMSSLVHIATHPRPSLPPCIASAATQELSKPADQVFRHDLTGKLEAALRSSNAQVSWWLLFGIW